MGYGDSGSGNNPYGNSGTPLTNVNPGWGTANFPARNHPVPPFNGEVMASYLRGSLDIRWDNPKLLSANTPWCIVGVNIYRSDVGERGPYFRLNSYPIGGTYYRDFTDNIPVNNEIVSWDGGWFYRGEAPNNRRWVLRAQFPIVKPYSDRLVYANSPSEVVLTIDGVEVPVDSVFGQSGEVELINQPTFDLLTEKLVPAILPDENSIVTITYRTNCNVVDLSLDRKITYRITTVAEAWDNPGPLYETPLEYSTPLTPYRGESMDYIWREAIRRNNWILEQGGERVKLFIRKTSGVPCDCVYDARRRAYHKQPKNNCLSCVGTGFVGGYEGPYEIILAPPDTERSVKQTGWGQHVEETYEGWTGPTPMITQRDFIVKQSGERYSIGPVRRPTNRGNNLQQHFNVHLLDPDDIRYDLPLDGINLLSWPESRLSIDVRESVSVYPRSEYGPMHKMEPDEFDPVIHPVTPDPVSTPLATEKGNIGDSREHRGRTQTWENQNY